jgi:hypothetical protein
MAQDDWRIRIELPEEGAAGKLLRRLHLDLGSEAHELAEELREHRLAVSQDDNHVFVYTASQQQAGLAGAIVEAVLRDEEFEATTIQVEHWLADEERWDDEPPGPSIEEEVLARGYAPWEVRVECASHHEADELADRLEQDGLEPVRRWQYVIVGTSSRDQAEELAQKLHGEVEPGGEMIWEAVPHNPFAVFGGLGGSGTPL